MAPGEFEQLACSAHEMLLQSMNELFSCGFIRAFKLKVINPQMVYNRLDYSMTINFANISLHENINE